MANNKALTDSNIRDVIAEWSFQDLWHSKIRPSDEVSQEYGRALMIVAGADGILAEAERKWIIGSHAAKGVGIEVLNYLYTYQPTKADLEAMINEKPVFTQEAARALVYEGFLAASADNELHADERNAIYRLGSAMSVDDTVIKQLEQAAADEKIHRKKVVDLVFPKGFANACTVAQTDLDKK